MHGKLNDQPPIFSDDIRYSLCQNKRGCPAIGLFTHLITDGDKFHIGIRRDNII